MYLCKTTTILIQLTPKIISTVITGQLWIVSEITNAVLIKTEYLPLLRVLLMVEYLTSVHNRKIIIFIRFLLIFVTEDITNCSDLKINDTSQSFISSSVFY